MINRDGIDRRGFLGCMAWAGTGMLYTFSGGVARAGTLDAANRSAGSGLNFVQISDSHIGFKKEANTDVIGTLQAAVDKINRLEREPAFIVHTGDISHLSKLEEWEAADSIIKTAKAGKTSSFRANTMCLRTTESLTWTAMAKAHKATAGSVLIPMGCIS